MRIQHVKIRNFRAVKEFDGEFGNITSLLDTMVAGNLRLFVQSIGFSKDTP